MKLTEAARVVRSRNAGHSWRSRYHVMEVDRLEPLFPVESEDL